MNGITGRSSNLAATSSFFRSNDKLRGPREKNATRYFEHEIQLLCPKQPKLWQEKRMQGLRVGEWICFSELLKLQLYMEMWNYKGSLT